MRFADDLKRGSAEERLRAVGEPHPTEQPAETVLRRHSNDLDQRHGTPARVVVRRVDERRVATWRHPLPVGPVGRALDRLSEVLQPGAGARVHGLWRVRRASDHERVESFQVIS